MIEKDWEKENLYNPTDTLLLHFTVLHNDVIRLLYVSGIRILNPYLSVIRGNVSTHVDDAEQKTLEYWVLCFIVTSALCVCVFFIYIQLHFHFTSNELHGGGLLCTSGSQDEGC